MAGSLNIKRNRQGRRHGKRNHRHASGNGMVRYYYGIYQQELRRKIRPAPKMFATVREALSNIGRSWDILLSTLSAVGLQPA